MVKNGKKFKYSIKSTLALSFAVENLIAKPE